jgi:DNA-binding transcriptional LysR family regulator
MASTIPWELLRSFLGVMQEGSLSGAARALGITQPTVGRHVTALEKDLGIALFTRSQLGLLPTEAAAELLRYAESMESTVAAFERAAAGHGKGPRGTVRVTASEVVALEVLPAIAAEVNRRHPALKIELVASNRVQDLLRREADIAVRMTAPKQGELLARRIGAIEIGLYAHGDYLKRRGTPRDRAELRQHALIGYDQATEFIRNASRAMPEFSRDSFTIRADSDVLQLALLRAGAGIAFCQVPLAKRSAELVRLLPHQVSLHLDTWVTMHRDLRNSPRCRVMFDALVQGLQPLTLS